MNINYAVFCSQITKIHGYFFCWKMIAEDKLVDVTKVSSITDKSEYSIECLIRDRKRLNLLNLKFDWNKYVSVGWCREYAKFRVLLYLCNDFKACYV